MSARKQNDATQSATPWPLTPCLQRQNPRLPTEDDNFAPKIEDIEEVEATIDEKPMVDVPDAVFVANT